MSCRKDLTPSASASRERKPVDGDFLTWIRFLCSLTWIFFLGCGGSGDGAAPHAGGEGKPPRTLVASGSAAAPSPTPVGFSTVPVTAERGLLVWESNRSGAWRIWRRPLDADAPNQLTRDEPGRRHCCPHLAPDGSQLVYLSLPDGRYDYPGPTATGELRLLELASGTERTLAPAARTYRENRAAVWHGREAVAFIDGEGRSVRIDIASGESEVLTTRGQAEYGWLIDATGSFATAGLPSFAPYQAERRAVAERTLLGGCQPYFSRDGRWGFWTAGAGGPINRIALASREIAWDTSTSRCSRPTRGSSPSAPHAASTTTTRRTTRSSSPRPTRRPSSC
jgi:hypothetical protein